MDIQDKSATVIIGAAGDPPPHRHGAEFILRALKHIAEGLSGEKVVMDRVEFRHSAPGNLENVTAVFGEHLLFDQPHTLLSFPSEYLKLSVLGHDKRLRRILERQARGLVEELEESNSIVRAVTELVTKELAAGNPNADHVASLLGVSVRTMSRPLKEAGTRYQALLDHVRFQLAARYLNRTRVDIGEVAFLLGFSDTSSFNRAFKRWSGETPSAYRTHVRNN